MITENVHNKGVSANALKALAMVTMFIDHLAYLIAPNRGILYATMHFIGAITGPLLFYFVVEGYHYTRNINRYAARLALFAVISYVPYIYFFDTNLPTKDNFLTFNVVYTILLGLLAIRAKNEIKQPLFKILALFALFLLSAFGDWGYVGILIMLVFDHFRGDYKNLSFAYIILILTANNLLPLLVTPLQQFAQNIPPDFSRYWFLLSGMGGLVPICLIRHYNGQKGKGGNLAKWSFYVFYPLHLVLLSLLRHLLIPF